MWTATPLNASEPELGGRIGMGAATAGVLEDGRSYLEVDPSDATGNRGHHEMSTSGKAPVGGECKKRKLIHRSVSRKQLFDKRKSSEEVEAKKSDPNRLTMQEIIRSAEASERKKNKEDVTWRPLKWPKKDTTARVEGKVVPTRPPARDVAPATVLAPQVQIVDGRIVINQQSLLVAAQASTAEDTDNYRRVEESASRLNYSSYSNKGPSEKWQAQDTELFYKAVEQFGTDFQLIQHLFPGRTRRQIKSKFTREQRLYPLRLAGALAHKAQDQSHHYKTIIDNLKAKGSEQEDDLLQTDTSSPVFDQGTIRENGGALAKVIKPISSHGNKDRQEGMPEDQREPAEALSTTQFGCQPTARAATQLQINANGDKREAILNSADAPPTIQFGCQPTCTAATQPELPFAANSKSIQKTAVEESNSSQVENDPAPKRAQNPLFLYKSKSQGPKKNPLFNYKSAVRWSPSDT